MIKTPCDITITFLCYHGSMKYPEGNVFQKILEGSVPADTVYEDESVLAFRDIAPKAPVHVLVIPKKHIACFGDLCEEDPSFIGLFFQKVHHVARTLCVHEGYKISIHQGKAGGQEVFHVHAHITAHA